MLGTTLWFVVVMGLMAAVLMDGAAGFGRAGVQAAAEHAVEAAMHDAVARYQNGLQTAIASADPAGLAGTEAVAAAPPLGGYATPVAAVPSAPVVQTPDPQASGAGPGFTVVTTVTPTTVENGADTIAWLQCNGFVQESRMSLRVTVRDQRGRRHHAARPARAVRHAAPVRRAAVQRGRRPQGRRRRQPGRRGRARRARARG